MSTLLLLLVGCAQSQVSIADGLGFVPSYAHKKPIEFEDLAYPWPNLSAEVEGLKLHYVELNPKGARTLLFVHGLGSNLKFWTQQLDHFAKQGFRVVALDLPGYGKSVKPATFPYTMESMAQVVRGFIANKGLGKPVLVGHSMGGHTALTFAIQWPGELEALILTAPAGFEKFSKREKAWFHSVVSTAFVASADEARIWLNIRRNNFSNWKAEYAWLVEERVRLRGAKDFEAYAYANVKSIHGLLETDFVRENLERIKDKTLIVHGDQDRLIPNPFLHGGESRDLMEWAQKRIGGAKLVTLEGCGHTVQMDCGARYNAVVAEYLKVSAPDKPR